MKAGMCSTDVEQSKKASACNKMEIDVTERGLEPSGPCPLMRWPDDEVA